MKIFRQLLLILCIYLIGEFIAQGLSIPIPGNIVGMILLFILLLTKVIKLEMIEMVANFFLDHLSFFFIPAGVGLMVSFGQIKSNAIAIILICIISTIIIMVTTGMVVQFVSNIIENKKDIKRIDN